ncbi:MAG: phosphoenolpyruvate synthase, partial [Deltaproteobacteria bacterium]|nr:phosphoenolpyruvate synthase [Kofleriaceae bacterium]
TTGGAWHGDGLGGRAAGPVAHLDQLGGAARVPRGAVIVTPAVTPAMALVIEGAAAIVCEHGSLLDHGPAMARELGVPCVVGCAGVVDTAVDGEWLEVDGDAGTVRRVGP